MNNTDSDDAPSQREVDANATTRNQSASGSARPSIVSGVAIALSICALLVSVFEVSAIRQETRYQVWPFVAVTSGFSESGYRVSVENKGVGPAKIRQIKMTLNGVPYSTLDDLIRASVDAEDVFSYELYTSSSPAGGVLSANERANYFAVPWEPRTRKLAATWAEQLEIELCYCSVYDECWVAQFNGGDPQQVSRCPISD